MSETTTPGRAVTSGRGEMLTARTIGELREALRDAERPIGLVPTMGALHDGHLSLLARARERCATVVMSLFINPSQFAAGEDLGSYPRDEARDARLAAAAGVDVLFAPPSAEMYPEGFATSVTVAGVSERLEGAARGPEHFRGVATVVTKLLNIVGPQVAYFGQKDAQQALVVERLVRDLDMAVSIEVCPTVRAGDGLALSSRNAYLSETDRERAGALWRALTAAAATIAAGERESAIARSAALVELELDGIEPEYLELVHPDTLAPLQRIDGPVLIALAARVGGARLIDNVIANPAGEVAA
jgi:pantoate--beta-alanine ligase